MQGKVIQKLKDLLPPKEVLIFELLFLVIVAYYFFHEERVLPVSERQEEPKAVAEVVSNAEIFFSPSASFESHGIILAERKRKAAQDALLRKQALLKRAASSNLISANNIPKNLKNPNSYRIALAEAPPLGQGKKVNGRFVCAKDNDKPRKSKENNSGVHIDRECCLDPDEVPHPLCDYTYKKK